MSAPIAGSALQTIRTLPGHFGPSATPAAPAGRVRNAPLRVRKGSVFLPYGPCQKPRNNAPKQGARVHRVRICSPVTHKKTAQMAYTALHVQNRTLRTLTTISRPTKALA